ncbi:MAG TPA: amidohydrolase family protein [Myxococcales bacterium]|jgi:6-methylsalicylate decarboxylase|nr:amidohydrolase family protein [Myxococcales bacterium]
MTTISTPHRIDVHQHVVPPFWAKELPTHGGDPSGSRIPQWSPERAIDFMDSQEIATGILSLTAPSIVRWDKGERREMALRVNEHTADLVAMRPDRFGNFATLPLPDVDGALRELEHALDMLGADGVILFANYAGKYLGDPAFEPLWAELGRRRAVVFVHPSQPPLPSAAGVAGALVDYPFDTTRAAVQLVLNGVVDRYPGARIILAHAGGFLPYASYRFAELARMFRADAASPDQIIASFQRFHFDTALSLGPAALPSLKAFAGSGRILFGSDFPYAPAAVGASFTNKLDAYGDLSSDERRAISHGNAQALFPRLAQRKERAAPAGTESAA